MKQYTVRCPWVLIWCTPTKESESFHWRLPKFPPFIIALWSHIFSVYLVFDIHHGFGAGLLLTDLGAAAPEACDTAEALRLLYKKALDSLQSCAFSGWASKTYPKGGVVRHFLSRLSSLLASTGIRSALVAEAHVGILEVELET